MVRADVAIGVTGSLFAALLLSYAVLPGSVVPQRAEKALAGTGTSSPTGRIVLVEADRVRAPLSGLPGSVAAPVLDRLPGPRPLRAVARAETRARADLVPTAGGGRRTGEGDALLAAGVALVRLSAPAGRSASESRSTGVAPGAAFDVAVGSRVVDGSTRTVSVVDGRAGRPPVQLRSVETLEGSPCPDAKGVVRMTMAVEVTAGPARGDGPEAGSTFTAALEAEVDAEAEVSSAVASLTTVSSSGEAGAGPVSAAGAVELDGTGSMGPVTADAPLALEGMELERVVEGLRGARALAAGALVAARDRWRSSGCLTLVEDVPDVVEPGSITPLATTVESLVDGRKVDAELSYQVDGPGKVVEKDGDLAFVAGRELGRRTTVRITATSRRGVVTAPVQLTTPTPDLRAAGTWKSGRATGDKCGGPLGLWELTLLSSGGSAIGEVRFRLDETLTGTLSGSREVSTAVGTLTVTEVGTVRYVPRRRVLVVDDPETTTFEVPVTSGAYCD